MRHALLENYESKTYVSLVCIINRSFANKFLKRNPREFGGTLCLGECIVIQNPCWDTCEAPQSGQHRITSPDRPGPQTAGYGTWHKGTLLNTPREHKIRWVLIMEPTSIPMYILSIPCLRSVCKAYKTGGRKSKISIKYCDLISFSDP